MWRATLLRREQPRVHDPLVIVSHRNGHRALASLVIGQQQLRRFTTYRRVGVREERSRLRRENGRREPNERDQQLPRERRRRQSEMRRDHRRHVPPEREQQADQPVTTSSFGRRVERAKQRWRRTTSKAVDEAAKELVIEA